VTPRERIDRLQALLERMLTRAAEPRAEARARRLLDDAYDDIRDEWEAEAPAAYEAEWPTESVPPPISAPIFTPSPMRFGAALPPNFAPRFSAAERGAEEDRASGESFSLEDTTMVSMASPDAPPTAEIDDPPEITDVFESRSRLMAAPPSASDEFGELEILGEAEPEDNIVAIELETFDDMPASLGRPITQPPESGPQVAAPSATPHGLEESGISLGSTAREPEPAGPSSMEMVLPSARSPGEYHADVHWIEAPAESESRTAEIVRPIIYVDVNVAEVTANTRAFRPATFGELLQATLDL
jgi:hypothetical protein